MDKGWGFFEWFCLCIIMAFVLWGLNSIHEEIKTTNKQLKTIIKLEQKQTATDTQKETTIPEPIIEENNLAN